MSKKKENPRQWQKDKKREAETKIINALLDGEKHLYSELVKNTGLSKATLSLHLEEMRKKETIGRFMETEKKYPYPVYYYLKDPEQMAELNQLRQMFLNILKTGEDDFRETKNPAGYFINYNNLQNQMLLTMIPMILKPYTIKDGSELFNDSGMWIDIAIIQPFEMFVSKFVSIVESIGKDLDLKKLNEEQKNRSIKAFKSIDKVSGR